VRFEIRGANAERTENLIINVRGMNPKVDQS
jgi:hypothetical protein